MALAVTSLLVAGLAVASGASAAAGLDGGEPAQVIDAHDDIGETSTLFVTSQGPGCPPDGLCSRRLPTTKGTS
jgi:hypothetical protein